MLSTSDKNGNLIIWRFDDTQFKVLCEISNCSESNITYMLWAPTGEYLFIANSSGTVSIIIFDEFEIKLLKNQNSIMMANEVNNNKNNVKQMIDSFNHITKTKRVIKPEMLPEKRLMDSPIHDSFQNNNNDDQPNNNQQIHYKNHDPITKIIAPCLRCERQMYQVIETQIYNIKIDSFDPHNVAFTYENKPYDNNCSVKLTVDSTILYANKYDNRMIKFMKANNFFYVFYDTNFTLNVFTLFNSTLMTRVYIEEVSLIESYEKYLLILTSQNRIIVIDTLTQKNIIDENLLIASEPYNVFQTKIDKIVFLALDKIVLYANTFNVYKNTNVKLVFLFNCTNHSLVQVTNILQCEEMIKETMTQVNSIRSIYNEYFEKNMEIDKREISIEEYNKNSSLMLLYEEQMKECSYFGKKETYLENIKKIMELIKENDYLKYKLYDIINGNAIPEEINNEVKQIIQNVL